MIPRSGNYLVDLYEDELYEAEKEEQLRNQLGYEED